MSLSVAGCVKEIINKSPFISEMMRLDLISFSNLARFIHEEVESMYGKSVNEASIIMAARRYAKELSELLPLLTNFWLIPSVYPTTPKELLSKFAFIKYLLDSMNLPIIDDEIFGMAQNYFERLNVGE